MQYKIALDGIPAFHGGYYDCHDYIYLNLEEIIAPKGRAQEDAFIRLKSYLDKTPYPDLEGLITHIKNNFDTPIALL